MYGMAEGKYMVRMYRGASFSSSQALEIAMGGPYY